MRCIVVAYERGVKVTNDMLLDDLAASIPIAFLESNCFRPLSELFSGSKDPNVLIQGCMDRSDEIKPPSIKGYGALTS